MDAEYNKVLKDVGSMFCNYTPVTLEEILGEGFKLDII